MSQMYEYLVVTIDHKSYRIAADSIKGVLAAIDEEETPILNIFRSNAISEGNRSLPARVSVKATPNVAVDTGCRAFPSIPVDTQQGKALVLSAVVTEGWKFEGWYCDDKLVATSLQATVIVEKAGDVTYEGRFSLKY